MTPEEHLMMEETLACAKRTNKWLFEPPIVGKPSRAQQLDDLMAGVRAGKMSFRVVLYAAGFVAAMGTAFGTVKGWWQ